MQAEVQCPKCLVLLGFAQEGVTEGRVCTMVPGRELRESIGLKAEKSGAERAGNNSKKLASQDSQKEKS